MVRRTKNVSVHLSEPVSKLMAEVKRYPGVHTVERRITKSLDYARTDDTWQFTISVPAASSCCMVDLARTWFTFLTDRNK